MRVAEFIEKNLRKTQDEIAYHTKQYKKFHTLKDHYLDFMAKAAERQEPHVIEEEISEADDNMKYHRDRLSYFSHLENVFYIARDAKAEELNSLGKYNEAKEILR